MQTASFRWFLNIILAGIIFSNAEAGRLLGIQSLPLHFSSVWPATGFSLAALLLFGYWAWPGVLAGNLFYNFLHLFLEGSGFFGPLLASTAISLGSLVQALLATSLMRYYSTSSYFRTIKDILVFLLAGGFLTCMIAATVGTATLYLDGALGVQDIPYTWLTFWSGDCMGVYIFTPLLVIWSLHKIPSEIREYRKEALGMLAAFIVLSLLFAYVQSYPVVYMFIPFSLWVAIRLGFHGTTACVLLISGATITITAFGHGSFIYAYPASPLLVLVMFLETSIITALLMAAARNELRAS